MAEKCPLFVHISPDMSGCLRGSQRGFTTSECGYKRIHNTVGRNESDMNREYVQIHRKLCSFGHTCGF